MDNNGPRIGTPRPYIVIAIELRATDGVAVSEAAKAHLNSLLSSGLGLACTLQLFPRLDGVVASTALFTHTGQTLALLRRIDAIQDAMRQEHQGHRVRYLVHYGMAFTSRPGSGYMGSGIRAAHSRLGRLPSELERGASSEFRLLADSWNTGGIHFHDLPTPLQQEEVHGFHLDSNDWDAASRRSASQQVLVGYLTTQLAAHMGPIAQVLVENASHLARSPTNLIEETAREIDDLHARARFRQDALDYLQTLAD